jgi:hypothetical protein
MRSYQVGAIPVNSWYKSLIHEPAVLMAKHDNAEAAFTYDTEEHSEGGTASRDTIGSPVCMGGKRDCIRREGRCGSTVGMISPAGTSWEE